MKDNEKKYTEDDLTVMMHEDLALATEECYWNYKRGIRTYSQALNDLESMHLEFMDVKQEAFQASRESWAAFEHFLEAQNA